MRYKIKSLLILLMFAYSSATYAQSIMQQINALSWQMSGVLPIGPQATLQLTKTVKGLNAADTSKFLELNGNLPTTNTYLVSKDDYHWFATFKFENSGYIKDDEKIDAAELLRILKENNLKGAEERRKSGLEALILEGWFVEPHYDQQTKRLEWGLRLQGEVSKEIIVNYSSRLLSRSGVMHATLVADPQTFRTDLNEFNLMLNKFEFTSGQRYEEFRQGDKVAAYGLGALVLGGAAAAAAKAGSGFLKAIGFAVVAFFGAIIAFFKRFFTKKPDA